MESTIGAGFFLQLMGIAPDVVQELVSGISTLIKQELTAAECAGIAVNFRRCLEKIAEAITPLLSDDWEIKEAKKVGGI